MIVSRSSTFEIKSKFSDSLVGRTFEFEIFPLSFEEFLVFKNKPFKLNGTNCFIDRELKELYGEYAMFGGYPAVVLETNKEIKEKMLVQIVETIETKLNFFQFQNAPFRAFARNYGASDYRMVALEGDRAINNGFYPWEL